MSEHPTIPDVVRERQVEASDPSFSVWVAANAGSGKTHVLAQRVMRLLLQGSEPGRILCITFTKAAAANMANRVFDELRRWTTLDDDALDRAIRSMSNVRPDTQARERARRLFALALETPGGLKVQTIHAFCTNLLHLFPFEANVPARFEVLDETAEAQLLDELTLKVLLVAAAASDSPLGRALAQAIASAADVTFRDLLRETVRQRDTLTLWLEAAGGLAGAHAELSRRFAVGPDETLADVDAQIFDDSPIARSEWPAIAAALAQGSKTDKDQSNRFRSLAGLSDTARLDAYLDIFCTGSREKPRERIATAAVERSSPGLGQRLNEERDRVWLLLQRRRAVQTRDRSMALATIAEAVIARYRTEKDRRGLLDYDDLIDKSKALLESTRSAWVHYKLDRGIDHVLIDEAQDTSPKQWDIIRALVAEFFAGEGARGDWRTIYAVGDEKQSIFSFQGAAPRAFEAMHREFHTRSQAARRDFHYVQFSHSFRSGANLLAAVDQVFARQDIYASITTDAGGIPPHVALPDAAPGLVEIWETEKPDDKHDIEGWDAPFDEVTETSPQVRLARRIARHVKLWRGQGRRPGEVLVLVRRRGAQFEAIIRALKQEGVAVAGADRLVLTEHIAVMDLMALADALLLPEDDLALATVLKSPLFGVSEDELFDLAYCRDGSLRGAVRSKRPDLAQRLDALTDAALTQTPFAFYAELLGAGGGRKAILARLGHEAADALDEFLNFALDYERAHTPSLQGFVAWLRGAQSEVKRDMEIARDEVRVMTVHGAKGLEAPIVILADTTTPPHGWHPLRLLPLEPVDAAPGAPPALVWVGAKANDVGPVTAARQTALDAARDEYRRLLYVAMTRPSERLIVCGTDGQRKRPDGCWYDLVVDALQSDCVSEPADDGAGDVLRFRKTPDTSPAARPEAPPPSAAPSVPDWLHRPVAAAPAQATTIKPSGFVDDPAIATSLQPGAARRNALLRGTVIHRLLQSLPDMPADRRLEAARRFLARKNELSDADRDDIARQVLRLLDNPDFAPLFAAGSRAEVSIAGRFGDRPLSGQVDRLAITPEAVLIADFKSNRPPPGDRNEVQRRYGSYVKQLALYRDVLMRLYPGRPVRAALVWTETPELMELPAAMLDAARQELAGQTTVTAL